MLTEGVGLQVRYNEARMPYRTAAFCGQMRKGMRVSLVASALIVALSGAAHSADKQVWAFFKSGKETLLFYGVPESEAVTLIFRCEAKRIEIVSTVLPAKPRKGQAATTTLSNGAVTAAYSGKFGYSSSSEGFYFEASTAVERKVVSILKAGTTLTISVPGKQERVPLRGVAGPLAKFEAACFRKR